MPHEWEAGFSQNTRKKQKRWVCKQCGLTRSRTFTGPNATPPAGDLVLLKSRFTGLQCEEIAVFRVMES